MKINLAEESLKELKTKKISLNFDVDTLKFVDEFSEIINATRTTLIMSLIGSGMKSFSDSVIDSFENIKKTGKHNQERVEDSIKKIKALKKKYGL